MGLKKFGLKNLGQTNLDNTILIASVAKNIDVLNLWEFQG